tara:strand:- start:928 stop:1107 length:180 start_codon:yes stop_codon:yes gene_type:complete
MDSIDYFDKRKKKAKKVSLEKEWGVFKKKSEMRTSDKKKDPSREGPITQPGSEKKAKDL